MTTMATLKAVVRDGRAVLVDDRVDYPEGTELELDVREPVDDLDDAELDELRRAVAESRAEEQAGQARSAAELIKELRASR